MSILGGLLIIAPLIGILSTVLFCYKDKQEALVIIGIAVGVSLVTCCCIILGVNLITEG